MLVGVILGVIFVTPLVVLYALIIRWSDRFEPEPWWLVTLAFLYGALFATVGGGVSSGAIESVLAAATGAEEKAPWLQDLGATVLAPVFEEGAKGVGVALIALASALGLKELDGPLDGAIYGGIIGLGFTLTEDILYVASAYAEGGFVGFAFLLFLRTVVLGLSHCTFTACTGIGFGLAVELRSWPLKLLFPVMGYGAAVMMHAMHNGLPTFFGGGGVVLMILISLVIDVLFFVILALLVTRDRAIVIRELLGEVGGLLHPRELQLVSSYFELGIKNTTILFSKGWRHFSFRRRKQLALVDLAFVKARRRRGENGADLDVRERELRAAIHLANRRGIWIGT